MSETFRFISAGAGSGKTYRLTALLHDMLIDGRVNPSGILATTFTNKAAAELRERVRSHLIHQGQYALATAIGQARIGTVNSVCGNLLTRFAFDAGMPVEQHVLDESRAAQMLDESIDEVIEGRTLKHLLTVARRLNLDQVPRGEGERPWKAALRAIVSQARSNAISPANLRDFGRRNADQLLGLFPTPTTRDLSAELLRAIATALPTIRQTLSAKAQKNTAAYLEQLEGFERDIRAGHFQWAQWNKLANSEPGAKLRAAVQTVATIAGEHAEHPRLHQDVREYLETLFSLGADVLDNFRIRKRQIGAVDFTDQESELLKILDLPQVAETLTAELDLLMVDEFQDTSPIQLALFLKLAQCAKHVVWVGDVKQAIYGFRGGDATLMTAVVKALPALKGEKETLKTSRRSRPALVHFVNDLLGGAFSGIPADDVHLKPTREEFQGSHAVEDWLLEGKNADDQYHSIAAGIATLLQAKTTITDPESGDLRPLRLGDIAVLARANDTVNALAGVLQAQGIMASTEQPGLLGRPEIVLSLACLRRLNDENDTIATAEIVSLAECEDPQVWLTERLAWLDSGAPRATWREADDAAHPIFRAIKILREQRSQLSPREAVHLVLARCHLGRCVLQWQQSPERARLRLANLDRLGELAGEYEDACRSTREAATLSGFLLWLEDLADAEEDTMPQPAIDAVQVMTHHAAKGLEWPAVVLGDLASDVKDSIWHAVRAESASVFDVQDPLKDRFLRYWPWPYGGQSNVPVADVVAASAAAQTVRTAAIEEHKRLLYVSMTRTRDILILARQAKKPDGEWMATIGLANFLPQTDGPSIALKRGRTVPFIRRRLHSSIATLGVIPPTVDLRWFEMAGQLTEKPSLTVSPSQSTPVAASVVDSVQIGTRVPVDRKSDSAALGEAVHGCLAAYFSSGDAALRSIDVQGILARNGVADALSSDDLLGQLVAVRRWLQDRWPNASTFVEIPIIYLPGDGQIMSGRVDLLLKVENGWILVDYKSGAQNSSQWNILAATYGGQLAAYSAAIEAATDVPVLETWLVLPVAGTALKVNTAARLIGVGVAEVA
jgi:ATP-dependent exoDNAse (exonuclease V) beta subunit